jgi:hypothetical protein
MIGIARRRSCDILLGEEIATMCTPGARILAINGWSAMVLVDKRMRGRKRPIKWFLYTFSRLNLNEVLRVIPPRRHPKMGCHNASCRALVIS